MNFILRCFPFHKWSQWEIKEEGQLFGDGFGSMTKLPTGHYILQQRKCLICNKIELQKVRT